jgi:hypothetical protein
MPIGRRAATPVAVLAVLCIAVSGCCSREPVEALERHGGRFIPTGEGPVADCPPVQSIWFDPGRIGDAELVELAPAIIRLHPHRLSLKGQPITERSADTLARLRQAGIDWIEMPDPTVMPARE